MSRFLLGAATAAHQVEENNIYSDCWAQEQMEHSSFMEPIVTLHHFSSPTWLIAKGGWEADSVVDDFARYVRYVMENLGDKLGYVCTINEANMRLQIRAVARQYMLQIQAQMAAADSAQSTESGVQVGIDLQKMMEAREQSQKEIKDVWTILRK